jgi:hypothetical protein
MMGCMTMALFKNLYLDLGFLNPFKKGKTSASSNMPVVVQTQQVQELKDLPTVSKKLLDINDEIKTETVDQPKDELPKVPRKPLIAPPRFTGRQEPSLSSVQTNNLSNSFFSTLQTSFGKNDSYIASNIPKDLLHKDLFSEMQSYWTTQKDQIDTMSLSKAMKDELSKKFNELQRQEVEWQKLKLQHDNLKDELASKEIFIEANIKQLKKTFKKVHFTSPTKPEHYFIISNGGKIRSLQELMEFSIGFDDSIFSHHVNAQKNDFATWINDVFNAKDLAQEVMNAKTKEQLHNTLANWYHSS